MAPALIMGVPCEMVVPFSSLAQKVPAPIPAHCHARAGDFAGGVGDGNPSWLASAPRLQPPPSLGGTLLQRINPEGVVVPVL